MFTRSVQCLCFLVFSLTGWAQGPSGWQTAERAKILEGVSSIPKLGSPGPIAIWGTMAFPLISAAEGADAELALAAAAGLGKGRIILFGHNSYLDAGNAGSGTVGKLLTNCVRWAGNQTKPTIAVKGADIGSFFSAQGFKVETIDGPVDAKSLNRIDVLVLNAQRITSEEEGEVLASFIKKGGGVIAAMTGWAYDQTSGGKILSVTHAVNAKAFTPAGISFTDTSAFGGGELREFKIRTELTDFLNASMALKALNDKKTAVAEPTALDMKQGSTSIELALAAQPPARLEFRDAVIAALGPAGTAVPTAQAPLTQDQHASDRVRLGVETRILRISSAEGTKAHPAATFFPGQPAADAPRVNKEVSVNPTIPGWQSTGLYAVAGETVSVQVPDSSLAKGWSVRIGCHSDTIYHLDSWKRAPEITRTVLIESVETKITSAFGGPVYINMPSRTDAMEGEVKVAIAGAVEAPYFKLGRDTDDTWNKVIKKHPGPWAEIAGNKMILSIPTEVARNITNPTQLMEFWDKAVSDQDEMSNQVEERKKPERMVSDVQISAGFMHSGYPIIIHVPEAAEMVTLNRLRFPGWGFYHEIGHNHQRGNFTFEGTGEVTNNVFALYNYTKTLGKDFYIGHPAIAPDALKGYITKARGAGSPDEKWQLWGGNPFHALTTYIQLVEGFGWDTYHEYMKSFADSSFGPAPQTDDEKRDQFLIRYSKITKKNLGPFFAFWGIPVSSPALSEVSKLEAWMPKGL